MKHFLLVFSFLFFACCLQAQEEEQRVGFWSRIDQRFGLSSSRNIDTNYYRLSPYGWMLNVNNNFALMRCELEQGHSSLTATSAFNYTVGVTAGYRNLILGYSFVHPSGSAHDMTLSISANAWGVEFRRYSNDDLRGTLATEIDMSAPDVHFSFTTPKRDDIAQGDITVDARYLRAYHVFSPRRFSFTAANDQRCIQLRSAGSVLFYTDYARHAVTLHNVPPIYFDSLSRLTYTSAAVGLGYGYNYTPNRGRLLIHLSAVPMFVVMMDEAVDYTATSISDRSSHFRMSCIARLAINYRINNHFGINLMATYNRNTLPADRRTSWDDLYLRATLCCRL